MTRISRFFVLLFLSVWFVLGFSLKDNDNAPDRIVIHYVDVSNDTYEEYLTKIKRNSQGASPMANEMASEEMFKLLTAPIGFSLAATETMSSFVFDASALPATLSTNTNTEYTFTSTLEQTLIYQDFKENRLLANILSPARKTTVAINTDLPTIEWKLMDENKLIAGYPCQLAIGVVCRDTVQAYFSKVLPLSIGPFHYRGLPGAILEVNYRNNARSIQAVSVDLSPKGSSRKISKQLMATYCDPPNGLKNVPYIPAAFCKEL